MTHKTISIAVEYTKTPAGRYYSDGSFTGERFREEFLYPALTKNDEVEIDLDDTLGYGSSYLEEAFGGLIREKNMDINELKDKLRIISSRALYENRIWQYLKDAQQEKNNEKTIK